MVDDAPGEDDVQVKYDAVVEDGERLACGLSGADRGGSNEVLSSRRNGDRILAASLVKARSKALKKSSITIATPREPTPVFALSGDLNQECPRWTYAES